MLVVWTPPSFEFISEFSPSALWFNPMPDPSVLFEPLFDEEIFF
jgi:hypothetical protein|tara:strand:+ start:374 stop:505 length:132 start_codon:yes stop_codon:yes gene_type:complete